MTTCPPACTRPESVLEKDCPKTSRYFVGFSPAVIFVASLSFFAFLAVVLGGAIVAAIHISFFFVLPLAAAAGGAFLVAAPEMTPLGTDPAVRLLLRVVGAIAIAYAGGAMLAGRSGCSRARAAHLTLVAGALAAMTAAFAMDDGSALAGETSDKIASMLARATAVATAGVVMTAAGPRVTKKIECGKPGEPAAVCFD